MKEREDRSMEVKVIVWKKNWPRISFGRCRCEWGCAAGLAEALPAPRQRRRKCPAHAPEGPIRGVCPAGRAGKKGQACLRMAEERKGRFRAEDCKGLKMGKGDEVEADRYRYRGLMARLLAAPSRGARRLPEAGNS